VGICASHARGRKADRGGWRDPGYPAFLAVTFAFGRATSDGGAAAPAKQAAWAVLMLGLAATAQAATRNAGGLVPIILVATYPGLLAVQNVLTQSFSLRSSSIWQWLDGLVATCVGKTARCAVAASVLCAALAACFRSRNPVPLAAVVVGAHLARPDTPRALPCLPCPVAAALALLAAGSRFGASDSDQASVVSSPSMFCNHLNIVVAMRCSTTRIVSGPANRADAHDGAACRTTSPRSRVAGPCLFFGTRATLDTHWIETSTTVRNAVGAAAAYRRIFLPPCVTGPLAYRGKFVRQMPMGLGRMPPYGLDLPYRCRPTTCRTCPTIMTRHGRAAQPIRLQADSSDRPTGPISSISAYLFRALSTAFVIAVIFGR